MTTEELNLLLDASESALNKGQYEESIKILRGLSGLFPSDGWIAARLSGAMKSKGQNDEAAQEMLRASFLNPTDPDISWLAGDYLTDCGNFVEAEQCYRNSIALERSPDRLALFGIWLEEHEQLDQALSYYQESYNLRSDYVTDLLRYAGALVKVGNRSEAAAEIAKFDKEYPGVNIPVLNEFRHSLEEPELRKPL